MLASVRCIVAKYFTHPWKHSNPNCSVFRRSDEPSPSADIVMCHKQGHPIIKIKSETSIKVSAESFCPDIRRRSEGNYGDPLTKAGTVTQPTALTTVKVDTVTRATLTTIKESSTQATTIEDPVKLRQIKSQQL